MLTILLFILSFVPVTANAHPVIYKDGVVVSSVNMESYSDNQLMYSWSKRFASGLNHWRFSKQDQSTNMGLFKTNYLLFRHNAEASQTNIYLHAGIGMVDSQLERKGSGEAYMTGMEADWENRNLYTSFKQYFYTSPGLTSLNMTQARIGFSPYESGFEQLQTWFMLQGMYMPEIDRKLSLIPMLRFFYQNVLWEVGSSVRGEWMLNLMVHY